MNAPRHFNPTARWLHWLMAAMIVAMLFIGVAMMASVSARPWLIDLHRPLGITILVLAVVRLRNRLRRPVPALPASLPRWQRAAATASHWLLYGLMLAMPLIGWAMLSAGGFPVQLADGVMLPPIAPRHPALYAVLRAAHGGLAYLLFATVLLHVAAALRHAWVLGDGVFASMARGGRRTPAD
ncbi:cytochrome B561 [Lysobacter arseniciresistens ZS79]|uniref:Cytochrome B561 n=1 Tax=Lysobacter arseniciresistens ZS79 TaxID=913325 RepID=A0A0A0F1I4_9GAMM|nr:cytochrome b [Lysobacter arseniciresistens]KGM56390.1 cytochrome B561 [Lysobacter arseniciresistens ZS79]